MTRNHSKLLECSNSLQKKEACLFLVTSVQPVA